MGKFNDFFGTLHERFHDENSLSDITYVLCKANEEFKKIFLKYCFEEDFTDIEIQREYAREECRPDFYVKNLENGKEYILESKIYDKNIHPEYKTKFKDMTRSFIANYNAKGDPSNVEKIYDFVKTWYGFIPFVQEADIEKDDFICGYVTYLKKTIDYLEVNSMNLSNVKSLPVLNTVLEKVVKNILDKQLEINNNKQGSNHEHCGKWIKYINKGIEKQFWIGINFDHEEWEPDFCLNCDDFSGKKEMKYYTTELNDLTWLYLKEEYNKKLIAENDIKEQEQIITNFLLEFLDQI
jgi:hypothetical protein